MSLRTMAVPVRIAAAGALLAGTLVAGGATLVTAQDEAAPLKFGMILVGRRTTTAGPRPTSRRASTSSSSSAPSMIVLDKVNPVDRPETTVEQVVDDMVDQGAQLIFATSDDMKDGIEAAAAAHPDVPMIWSSGDSAWAEGKDYQARPDQPRQHHGPDGVRQDDRRLRRRADDPDRQDRLPRSAHQRRDPPPGQLGLPGREVLLGDTTRARTRPTSRSKSSGSGSGSTSPASPSTRRR